jgi:hypothetical protein
MNSSERFFVDVKGLYLPVLTRYFDGDDRPTYPWIANNRVGLSSGLLDDLVQADPVDLYPDHLFAPSQYREGGYALWDFIIRNGRTFLRTAKDHGEARAASDKSGALPKPLNTWWLETVAKAYLNNDFSTLPFSREFYRTDGYLIEAAHALTHRYGDGKVGGKAFWKSYACLSDIFVQYLADLYVASEFEVPIDIYEPPGHTLAWGIAARPTVRIGFAENRPLLQQAYSYMLPTDRDFAYISVAIEVGADPVATIAPGAPTADNDRLAHQPFRLFFAGWCLAPWLYGQDIRWPERIGWGERVPAAFTATCEDLFAPQALPMYLNLARQEASVAPRKYHRPLEAWTEELNGLISMTATLPCCTCLLFNRQIENGIQLAPRRWAGKKAAPQELEEYKKKLQAALRLTEKAAVRFGGKGYRKLRGLRRRSATRMYKERKDEVKRCRKDHYGFFR